MRRRRKTLPRLRWTSALAFVLVLLVAKTALTGTNLIPASRAGQVRADITASALAPATCAGLGVTTTTSAANGSPEADLQLGAPGNDNLDGKAGNDCVLGGGGNDSLGGGAGTDVCIGGPGNDNFDRTCETKIQ